MKKSLWIISFLLFLFLFFHKVIFQGAVIGPFDFLVGFYDPFREIPWGNDALYSATLHYKNYLMSDVVVVILPVKLFAMELLSKFQIPLWNPYILNGSPLLANVQSALLYPFNILYFIFNSATAFNIYIISQLLLAFVFMFLFLRSAKLDRYSSYFGALAFSFSSYFIVWLPWGTLGHTFLWLPLALYAINNYFASKSKKYGLIFVLSLVCAFFAGHTQTAVVVFGISLLFLLFMYTKTKDRKSFLTLGELYILVFFLVAVQLLPSAEMYGQSVRDLVATSSFYKDQTLNFSSYLMAMAPDFFGSPVTRNWWGKTNYAESSVYFGVVSLFFASLAILRRKMFDKFLFTFLFSLLLIGVLASTQNVLSYLLFKLHLPLVSSSAFSRYGMIFIFSGSVLSALGMSSFLKDIKKGARGSVYTNSEFFVITLALLWILILTKKLPSLYLSNLTIIKRNTLLPTALILVTVSVALAVTWISRRWPRQRARLGQVAPILLIVLLSLELLRFSYKYTPFSPRAFFFPEHAVVKELRHLAPTERFTGYFPTNTNTYYQIKSVGGGDPLYNKRVAELVILGNGIEATITDRSGMEIADGPYRDRVLDLLSVKYFVDKTDNFRNSWVRDHGGRHDLFDAKFKVIWEDDLFKILENASAVPHHQLFYKAEFIPQKEKALARLISGDFNPHQSIVVDKNINLASSPGQHKIKSLANQASRQEYRVRTSSPTVFAVTDTYYPGWNVYVDHKKQEMLRVNHAFRGVYLEKGNHIVRFAYEPMSVLLGLVLSLAAIIVLIAFVLL